MRATSALPNSSVRAMCATEPVVIEEGTDWVSKEVDGNDAIEVGFDDARK
jgi:hypothetical protein